VRGDARERLLATLAALQARADFDRLDMAALLNALVAAGERIEVQYVHGHWRGVNDLDDFRRAGDFAHAQAPYGAGGAASAEGARD
jgi:phosphoenolpyruvate phosphomutase